MTDRELDVVIRFAARLAGAAALIIAFLWAFSKVFYRDNGDPRRFTDNLFAIYGIIVLSYRCWSRCTCRNRLIPPAGSRNV